jgi:hypothetical protein
MSVPDILSRDEIVHILEDEHGLSGGYIYLLELVPLIEMMWADGKNQDGEVRIVYDYALKHLADLSRDAAGEEILTVEEVNEFLDRFVHQRPSPTLLKRLRQLARSVICEEDGKATHKRRAQTILEQCLDIAAAAVTHYPYGSDERFMREEKELLRELMEELCLSPNAMREAD